MKSLCQLVACGLALGMFSCASETLPKPEQKTALSRGEMTVTVINKTWMDIEVLDETRLISHNSEKTISLPLLQSDLNDGYSVSYRVKVMDPLYIKIPRREHLIIDPQQDKAVIESVDFLFESSYFILKNKSPQTISLRKDRKNTPTVEYILPVRQFDPDLSPVYQSPYIKPGDSGLYTLPVSPALSGAAAFLIEKDLYKTSSLSIDPVHPGHIYTFVFDGPSLVCTDERPLHRVGEPTWSKTFPDAAAPVVLISGEQVLSASAKDSVQYRASSGGAVEVQNLRQEEDALSIEAVLPLDGAFLLAGYTPQFTPVARKQGEDGRIHWDRLPSYREDSLCGYFLTAAERSPGSWLVAGGSDNGRNRNSPQVYGPYLQEIKEIQGSLGQSQWELGPDDFPPHYGAVKSAAYDSLHERYLITGDLQDGAGAYLADIDGAGNVQSHKTLEDFICNRLLIDREGAYYVIGEEQRSWGSFGVVRKYTDAHLVWQQPTPLPANSYYYAGMLQEGTLVLGGTMQAHSSIGEGGIPLIEALSLKDGSTVWRQSLEDPVFARTSLVTGIAAAPDYGYLLSLSGINKGFVAPPFMIVRVNTYGRLADHQVR
jgi:hypothetical protein